MDLQYLLNKYKTDYMKNIVLNDIFFRLSEIMFIGIYKKMTIIVA